MKPMPGSSTVTCTNLYLTLEERTWRWLRLLAAISICMLPVPPGEKQCLGQSMLGDQKAGSVQPVELGPNWQAPFQKALLHPVDAQVEHFQGQLRVQTGRTNERPDYRTWPKSSFKAIPRIEMFCPGTGKDREIETFIPLSEDLP